jgi:hypothetical protein
VHSLRAIARVPAIAGVRAKAGGIMRAIARPLSGFFTQKTGGFAMKRTKFYFVAGIAVGAILTYFCMNYFAPRYEMERVGVSMVKTDKWTGESWKYVNDSWKKIERTNQEWQEIDQALAEALNIPVSDNNTESALSLLREKYPILNEELQERIKLVYSSQILQDLYLDDFMKRQKQIEGE